MTTTTKSRDELVAEFKRLNAELADEFAPEWEQAPIRVLRDKVQAEIAALDAQVAK
jgi:hypothetical protein